MKRQNCSFHQAFLLLASSLLVAAAIPGAANAQFPVIPLEGVEFLYPFGSAYGEAWDIDGNNVVGTTTSQKGFLYDGQTYTVIQPPGAGTTEALGISGDRIVGYFASDSIHGFLFDGTTYTTLDAPLAVRGTVATGIHGNNIVGYYNDSSNRPHGFIYDGNSYTTIDHPLGVRGTRIQDIWGDTIVGIYFLGSGASRGFMYDGTTWTNLMDPLVTNAAPLPFGIDHEYIVGNNTSGSPFIYDGTSYSYALNSLYDFSGISGNKLVGNYYEGFTGLDRPFIYTSSAIPETSSLLLASLGTLGMAILVYRQRRSPFSGARMRHAARLE